MPVLIPWIRPIFMDPRSAWSDSLSDNPATMGLFLPQFHAPNFVVSASCLTLIVPKSNNESYNNANDCKYPNYPWYSSFGVTTISNGTYSFVLQRYVRRHIKGLLHVVLLPVV